MNNALVVFDQGIICNLLKFKYLSATRKEGEGGVEREGVGEAIVAAAGALQGGKVGTAAEGLAEIAGEGADVGAFGAGYADRCFGQA